MSLTLVGYWHSCFSIVGGSRAEPWPGEDARKLRPSLPAASVDPPSCTEAWWQYQLEGDVGGSLIPVVADLSTVVGGSVDGFLGATGALSAALLGLALWASLVK